MDIEQYIASGILEAYALGQVSEQEQREVQCMSSIYPEIAEALRIREADAEQFARAYAKKAPDALRQRLMAEVYNTTPDAPAATVQAPPGGAPQEAKTNEVKALHVVQDAEAPASGTAFRAPWVWAAAAAALLAIFGLQQYFENQALLKDIDAGRQAFAKMEARLDAREAEGEELREMLSAINLPGVKKVVLEPVSETQALALSLFWDTTSGSVVLDMSALPGLPAHQQYQLWVLKDGQPVDMGVLPVDVQGMMRAEAGTLEGDAFAITIEPLGGQASPSLDQLVVLGNIG